MLKERFPDPHFKFVLRKGYELGCKKGEWKPVPLSEGHKDELLDLIDKYTKIKVVKVLAEIF